MFTELVRINYVFPAAKYKKSHVETIFAVSLHPVVVQDLSYTVIVLSENTYWPVILNTLTSLHDIL